MKKILFFMLLVVCGALASSCEGKTSREKIDCEYNERIAKANKQLAECNEGKNEEEAKACDDVWNIEVENANKKQLSAITTHNENLAKSRTATHNATVRSKATARMSGL